MPGLFLVLDFDARVDHANARYDNDIFVLALRLAVDAIFVVLAQRITGAGATLEQQVVESLSVAVQKYR